jgi:prepilin-type N-terminal cleavage/methylation domain-containing protein
MGMQAINKTCLKSENGLSLVELLMAMAASLIILAAVYSVFTMTQKNFTTQNVAASTQQNLRSAIGLMTRDIRVAGLDPAGSGNFGFRYASRTKIHFTLDSIDSGSGDFNGTVDETNFEQITYEFQGGQIMQTLYEDTASENAASLISSITVAQFSYFDAANNDLIDAGLTPPRVPTDQLGDIRTVEILMTIQEPAGRDEPVERTLTRRVECRNMAFN